MNSDGSGAIRLTSDPAIDHAPSWSPDGAKILFNSTRPQPAPGLYVMNADGSDETLLVLGGGDAEWSPDGSKIVFIGVSPSATNSDIYVMNPDGSNQVNITNDDINGEFQPTWSPNGGEIAYQNVAGGPGDIW